MENAFGRIAAIFLLVIALFIVPVFMQKQKMQALMQVYVSTKAIELVDSVRNTARLSKEQLALFYRELPAGNSIYEVTLEHRVKGIFGDRECEIGYYTEDIQNVLEEKGEYVFHMGDYLRIVVYENLQGEKSPVAYYGGVIKNEMP